MSGVSSYEEDLEVKEMFEEAGDKMPKPTGYRMLVALPLAKEKSEGGIYLPDERRNAEQVASIVGMVIAMGDDCYADQKRFPNGPWCQTGDWVLMSSYSGTRFELDGTEFRILNDDSIEAVLADPTGVVRL